MVKVITRSDRTEPVVARPRGSHQSGHRARIIEIALRLFRQIGHKKTTVADIARAMSMSPANVYRFFASKRAVEEAVVGKVLDEVIIAAFDAAHGAGSAIERLRAVLQAVEQWHKFTFAKDGKLYELVACATQDDWTVASAYTDRLNSVVAQIITEGQVTGELAQGNPMTFARCILVATSSYLQPAMVQSCAKSARPTLNQMIEFSVGALRAGAHWQHLAA
jgi:AcrR family transcriptional regulator